MVTEHNTSFVASYNFASGGATVDAEIVPPYTETVLSLVDQVAVFSSSIGTKPDYAPWTAENAIAGIWIGVNDVGNTYWNADSTETYELIAARYFEQLQILYGAGIRQYALLSVPRMLP